jgi:protein transport protein SEC31
VDTSRVPPAQQGVVRSLAALYEACLPLAATPAKKREMDDNSRKIGQLFWRLAAGEVWLARGTHGRPW